MQNSQPNVLARHDTLLGVCEALGEDFGINPQYLRVAFAAPLLWNPVAVLAAYLGLGLIVAFSRWLVPNRRLAEARPNLGANGIIDVQPAAEPRPLEGGNQVDSNLAVAA